jgi:hypothetical protein
VLFFEVADLEASIDDHQVCVELGHSCPQSYADSKVRRTVAELPCLPRTIPMSH